MGKGDKPRVLTGDYNVDIAGLLKVGLKSLRFELFLHYLLDAHTIRTKGNNLI
jgi:hypothetical protein